MLKRFWGALVSLGVVVGLVAAADQLNIVRWVVGTVVLSLLVVAAPPVVCAARARIQAYRERPALLARVEEAGRRTSQGILEGRAQVLGALLAAGAGVPSVVSIRLTEHDQLQLCCKVSTGDPTPSIGARYVMYAEGQEDWPVGTCSVIPGGRADAYVWLAPVEFDKAPYWRSLATRARQDTSAPIGMLLMPAPPPEELTIAIGRNGHA